MFEKHLYFFENIYFLFVEFDRVLYENKNNFQLSDRNHQSTAGKAKFNALL